MKRNMWKTTFREVRGSFGRFFAIFAIIALGVGFFSGVRITTPAMVNTMDKYLQECQFYDYRLISTLGWEKEDIEKLRSETDVRYVEGSISIDALYKNSEDEELVLKTHMLPQNINGIEVSEGRLPVKSGECVLDGAHTDIADIGEELILEDTNDEDTLELIIPRKLKVVGYADSSYYVNFERGTTSIGTGTVNGFIYIPENSFDSEIYTEVFVRFDQDYQIYSKAYKDYMKDKKDAWEDILEAAAKDRYDRIVAEAEEKLSDAESELADKRRDGEKELSDARAELEDAEKELSDAKVTLDDGRKELDDSKVKLTDAWKKLSDAKKTLDSAKVTLDDTKEQLDTAKQQLETGEKELKKGQNRIDKATKTLDTSEAKLDKEEAALLESEEAYNKQMDEIGPAYDYLSAAEKAALAAAKLQLDTGRAAIAAGRKTIETSRNEIAKNQKKLNKESKRLEEARKQYESGKKQYEQGLKDYESGKKDYEKGLSEYYSGKKKLADGEKEYEDGLAEYEDGLKEYEDGLAEYHDGEKEFEDRIAEAEEKLADAREDIEELEEPDTFLLERNTNIGYACFENDSEIVAQVAKVFPVFFVLVAALVCITTMSRMVEERRTEIGTLKALGYSEGAVMLKYVFYSGSAALMGCAIGYFGGIYMFPKVIWTTYRLMYRALPIYYLIDWRLWGLSLGAAMLCSIGATWLSCRYELSETAASLMRPKAPKAGKRVFLEYIPFIWNRLRFLYKVSIRNILRYKGRFFMMVVGIGGCTALLVTGFGIKDSVAGFADMQYEEIVVADAEATFKDADGAKLPQELGEALDRVADGYLPLYEGSWDMVTDTYVKEVSLIAPLTYDSIKDYVKLHTMDGEELTAPEVGEVYICNSLSERYDVALGDSIVLRDSDMRELYVTVAGIFENHVYNYVFIAPETYERDMGSAPDMNAAYITFPESEDVYEASAELAKTDSVVSVSVFDEIRERMGNMMSSLDYIVLVVIVSAAGLAFIVLYNLTNINITERIREIATIKVLGFFRGETSAYVFRENIALTAFGVLAGLGLGKLLHLYVMKQIVVDMVSFKSSIRPISYLYSVILTFIFTALVNAVMGIKLDRINMAESLKSVE